MIDTNKLLSNRSSGSTTLSRKSVINIGLIREDVIKIDGLLKNRLVLSKVRDGIERQSLERLKRKKSEDDLESEVCDCDDDDRRRDPDSEPKKGRGLIGFLIGGALAVIGGIAMKFLPIILSLGKFIGRIAKVFTFVIGGTFAAIGNFISLFNDGSKKIKGIDKDQLDEGYVNDVFTNFNGALDAFVTSLIIGGAISMGLKGIRGRNAKTAVRDLKVQETKVRRARRRKPSRSFAEVKREIDLREYDSLTPEAKARIRRENISRTLREAEEVIPNRKPRVQYEDFLGMNKPRKGAEFTGPDDLLQTQRQRSARRITTNVTDKAIQDAIKKGRNIKTEFGDPLNIEQEIFKKESGGKKVKVSPTSKKVKRLLKKSKQTDLELGKTIDQESLELSKGFSQKTQRFIKKNVKAGEKLRNKILGGGDTFNPLNNLKQAPMGEFGFSTSGPINPNKFFKTNRQILEGTDLLKAPIIKDLNPKLLLTKGGGSILLKQIGGEAFAAAFKQGLKSAVGVIPFIGDLIGILLDIFVFGEPVGRAIFKGIGSFAIAALLGGLGFAVGGPVGAFIGSVAGGIGGDILGGIVYDMFFGKNAKTTRQGVAGATKAGVKALTQYGDGGYVGEPSFKPLVNSVDKSINLRTTPSYAMGGGKVKFIPLPIPIPTKGQSQEEEEQQLSMTSNTIETKTFAGLYKR